MERRRRTPADYRALAQKRGFRWLGPEVPNVLTKTQWECKQGHRWWARFSKINEGRGCPICANRYPKTAADYQAMAEKRGFRWLGPEVVPTALKTTWECSHGHHWQATYKKIHQGSGCPTCAKNRRRKTRFNCQTLAQKRGYRWLGPEVSNAFTETEWECDQGHRWWISYRDLQRGRGCPICGKSRRRKTPADYRAMAQKRGFRWLEVEVATTAVKTQWECQQGHRWWATYKKIHQGSGCPVCAGRRPKPPPDS